jgi:hypothetical protein
MSRITIKDLKEELRIVRQRVLELETKLQYLHYPYKEPEPKSTKCCRCCCQNQSYGRIKYKYPDFHRGFDE